MSRKDRLRKAIAILYDIATISCGIQLLDRFSDSLNTGGFFSLLAFLACSAILILRYMKSRIEKKEQAEEGQDRRD